MFTPGVDYVYVPNGRVGGSQVKLRDYLEDATTSLTFVNVSDPKCFEAVSKALCIHYYLPCGFNGSLHVPQFLCGDVCHYLTDAVCRTFWPQAMELLRTGIDRRFQNMGLDLPICNDTSKAVASLELSEDCCITGGVIVPPVPGITSSTPVITNPLVTTPSPSALPAANNIFIIGSAVGGGVALLVAIITVCLLVMFLCWKRRNTTRRKKADMPIWYVIIVYNYRVWLLTCLYYVQLQSK